MSRAKIKMLGTNELVDVYVDSKTNTVLVDGNTKNIDELDIDIPVNGTVFGTLLNYKGELKSYGDTLNQKPYIMPPIAPVLYIKPANTLNANGKSIPIQTETPTLTVGAALGLVIGRQATAVKEKDAFDFIEGYTIVNDVSIPHESIHRPAIQQKCRDGFCPIGPWIVAREEVSNPDNLSIRVSVNGELRQEGSTSDLIRPIAKLMADVTEYMTLHVGDVLLVGVQEKVPQVEMGDYVSIEIESIGKLENHIVEEKQFYEVKK